MLKWLGVVADCTVSICLVHFPLGSVELCVRVYSTVSTRPILQTCFKSISISLACVEVVALAVGTLLKMQVTCLVFNLIESLIVLHVIFYRIQTWPSEDCFDWSALFQMLRSVLTVKRTACVRQPWPFLQCLSTQDGCIMFGNYILGVEGFGSGLTSLG